MHRHRTTSGLKYQQEGEKSTAGAGSKRTQELLLLVFLAVPAGKFAAIVQFTLPDTAELIGNGIVEQFAEYDAGLGRTSEQAEDPPGEIDELRRHFLVPRLQ
jgi:hypothetical protein